MKVPYSWLTKFVPVAADGNQLSLALTRLGIEVEGVTTPAAGLDGVVVGRILTRDRHPNADRLSLLSVEVAAEAPLQIVCGATNMQANDLVAVATIGTKLPNGLTIKRSKIRNIESFGMCCSEVELGLADESSGIMILPPDATLGQPVIEALGLEKLILELSVTANRGDCMSMLGIARELAALFDLPLVTPQFDPAAVSESSTLAAPAIAVHDVAGCPYYLARPIRGVTVAASPDWMQRQLLAAGMRPINGVVDVLNYTMLEIGQPMHAFDAATVGHAVVVRSAEAGEKMVALDGRELTLADGDLVIADGGAKVLALAGVIGAMDSGVSNATTDLLLESALFDKARISMAARRHGVVSEASMRFERGINPDLTIVAMQRATALILELFGGEAGAIHSVGADPSGQQRKLATTEAFIAGRLGAAIPASLDEVLNRMGFAIERAAGAIRANVPNWRHDITIPEDLSEEYARVLGYDNIPQTMPLRTLRAMSARPATQDMRLAVAGGYTQVVNYAFISPAEQRLFTRSSDGDITLANPISDTMQTMRRSLFPGLLATARRNLNRQQRRIAIVESGRSYRLEGDSTITEEPTLAWLLAGVVEPAAWHGKERLADLFDLKGEVERWAAAVGHTLRFLADDALPGLQPGQSARILVDDQPAGVIGKLDLVLDCGIDLPIFLAEIELQHLPPVARCGFAALPEFPSVERDLVFLLPTATVSEQLLGAAALAAGGLLTNIAIFDRYTGANLPTGHISLGLRLSLQAADRTLTQEEADNVCAEVVSALGQQFGAKQR